VSSRPRLLALLAALGALAMTPPAEAAERPFHVERDISYEFGGTAANRLDLYWPRKARRPAHVRRRAVVVWIHGGGWRKGDKRTGVRKKAELFTRRGYVFASVNYRLASAPFDPDAPDPDRVMFPVQPEDVGAAVGWLQRHVASVGGDATNLVLIGHSAGAHLAALVAVDRSYVQQGNGEPDGIRGFVALDSPTFDVARDADPETSDRNRDNLEMLWNAFGTPSENDITGDWRRASPLAFADPRDPPGLFVTQAAIAERVEENQLMREALAPSRSRVRPLPLDHREINRVLGEWPDASGETRAVVRFIRAVHDRRFGS
jgi:acetyl esterase/lipase